MATEHATDQEIMDGLTEDERAALAEDDGDNDADNKNDKEDDADGGAGGAGDDGVAGAKDGADDGAEGDDGKGKDDDAGQQPPEPQKQNAPLLVAQAPADAEAKLTEITGKKEELRTKYNDGDITFEEYEAEKDGLVKQEREIERAVDKAQIAADMQQQQQKNQWDADCNAFLAANPEYNDTARFAKINEAVIALANMPSNKDLSGPEILSKAHKFVKADAGEEVKPAVKGEKPAVIPKPDLPPNLGKVPSAAPIDTGEGRFAALDKLEGMAFETALAKLSDSEREAYLAA